MSSKWNQCDDANAKPLAEKATPPRPVTTTPARRGTNNNLPPARGAWR